MIMVETKKINAEKSIAIKNYF